MCAALLAVLVMAGLLCGQEWLSWLREANLMGRSTSHMTRNNCQALVSQSVEEAGDAEQQAKPKKVKRRREAESPADPEEALRLKAEAARIAAEVFAGAELADDDDAPEQEPTKVSAPSSWPRPKPSFLLNAGTPVL